MRPHGEQQIPITDEEMNEEGEIDDESDAGDSELDEDEWREAILAGLIPNDAGSSRSDSREGSPMDLS